MTQSNLGEAYCHFVDHHNEQGRYLRKSIVAYHEALKIFTRQQSPIDYARTMGGLAITYGEFACVEIRMDYCTESRKYIREALDILTEKEFPLDHQKFQKAHEKIDEICSQIQQKQK